jgi:hypothetical protein
MLIIPLKAVPSQAVTASLGGQNCQVNVYQKSTGLFCDVYVSDVLIIGGVICQNLNRIVRSAYLGFLGDLFFFDQHGTDDPDYTGVGSRYLLYYLEVGDAA